MELDKTCLDKRIADLISGTITADDGNATSLAVMPTLHIPQPVNSKTKYNDAYESKHHEHWNRLFVELVEFKEKNWHCNLPTTNRSLGSWIRYQRLLFSSNKLRADRNIKTCGDWVRIWGCDCSPRFQQASSTASARTTERSSPTLYSQQYGIISHRHIHSW